MLCVKAHLPTKQNADSQKKTCFKCFTETACFTQTSRKIMFLLRPSLRPQLHALGWLAGLLLSKLSSAAVCFAMNVLQGLSRGDALSTQQPWFSQKLCCTQNHSFTDQPCLTQVPCPASSASCSCWVGCFATLSLDCTEEQGWFTPAPFPASPALCSCLLAGLTQIALAVVAGGTRQRRLNSRCFLLRWDWEFDLGGSSLLKISSCLMCWYTAWQSRNLCSTVSWSSHKLQLSSVRRPHLWRSTLVTIPPVRCISLF